ncbi:MAG: Gfo/Idh/MocA family protein [Promethearchaeota archaeon]
MLKICHVGCGRMSVMYYGPSYVTYLEHHPDSELVACCDIDEEQAKLFSSMVGFTRHYTDIDAMLDAEAPDVAVLVVAEKLIAPLATQIMGKGVPVVMEKPPGRTPAELDQMLQIAGRYGVATQVNFNRRFTPLLVELKRLLGERYPSHSIHYLGYDFWRVQRREPDFYMTAIHGIDAVRFLLDDDYKVVNYTYQPVHGEGSGFENYFLDGEMHSGTRVHLNFIVDAGVLVERVVIQAKDETIFCNIPAWGGIDTPGSILIFRNGKKLLEISGEDLLQGIEDPDEPHYMGFYDELRVAFETIRVGGRPGNDLQACKQSLEVAWLMGEKGKIYRSHGHST